MNNNCKQIDGYLSNELAPDIKSDFEKHISTCPACQKELAIEQNLDDSIQQAWESVAAPKQLYRSLSVAPEKKRTAYWNSQVAFAAVTIASTILLAVSIAVWNSKPGESELGPTDSLAVSDANPETDNRVTGSAIVTVIPVNDSATIIAPQPQVSSEFTILNAYSAVTPKPISINISEN